MNYALVVACVLGAFALKITAISGLSLSLRKHASSDLDAWLGSWLFVQCATITFMMAASIFDALNFYTIWGWLLFIAIASRPINTLRAIRDARINLSFWHIPLLLVIALVAIRSLSFFDYTGDAYAYGYTRLAIWMNYGSLFVHMPTPQINIFTNEWNGELTTLLYGLAATDLQGLSFGNFEVLIVFFMSVYWLCRKVGCETRLAYFVALAVTGTPACLGLASTIKGDLLACVGVVLAAGWILNGRGDKGYTAYPIMLCMAALGLATGSKISSFVTCAVMALVLVAVLAPKLTARATWAALVSGAALASVFCARYFTNIFVYGEPLNRAADEGIKAGFDSFIGNFWIIAERWFTFFPEHPPFAVWALSGGLGLTGAAAAIHFSLAFFKNPPLLESDRTKAGIILAIGLTALFLSMALIGPKDWSLRYFLPALSLILAAVFCLPLPIWARKLPYGLPIVAALNFLTVLQPGEVTPGFPNLDVRTNWNAIGEMSSIQRALLFHPGTYQVFDVEMLGLDSEGAGKTIAVNAEINVFLFQLVGAQAQNRLILTETLSELEAALKQRPDVVVITRRSAPVSADIREAMARNGYTLREPSQAGDSKLWLTRRPESQSIGHKIP